MSRFWSTRDALAGYNEGRACELSRRATFAVLFSRQGRPGMWLMLVGGLWGLVAAITLGTPG